MTAEQVNQAINERRDLYYYSGGGKYLTASLNENCYVEDGMLKEQGLAYELEVIRLFSKKPTKEIENILDENIQAAQECRLWREKWEKVKKYVSNNKVPITIGGKKKYVIVTELLLNSMSYIDRNAKLSSEQ